MTCVKDVVWYSLFIQSIQEVNKGAQDISRSVTEPGAFKVKSRKKSLLIFKRINVAIL